MNRKIDGLGLSIKKASSLITPIVTSLFRKFLLDKFDGHIDNLGSFESKEDPITYEFSNLGWGNVETLGYRIRVKGTMEEEIVK
jgi:hypothetical protein